MRRNAILAGFGAVSPPEYERRTLGRLRRGLCGRGRRCSLMLELAQEGRGPFEAGRGRPESVGMVVALGVDVRDGLIASRADQDLPDVRRGRLKPCVRRVAHGHDVRTDLLLDPLDKR